MCNLCNPDDLYILVKGLNWVGDAVLSTPFFESLRKGYPDAFITVISKPVPAEILINNPDIDSVISIDHSKYKFQSIKILRKKKYEMGILLPRSLSSALLLYFGGIKNITGYNTQFRGFFLDNKIAYTDEIKQKHQVYLHLNLAYSLNCPEIEKPALKLISKPEFDETINQIIEKNEKYILVFPGTAAGVHKQWPIKNFAETAKHFIEKGYKIFVSGSPAEKDLVDIFCGYINKKDRLINLVDYFTDKNKMGHYSEIFGNNPIQEIISLMKRVDLILCNDSGPMHIAAALKVKTIAIFTSTCPVLTGPISDKVHIIKSDLECAPCRKKKCKYKTFKCAQSIKTEEVINKMESILSINTYSHSE